MTPIKSCQCSCCHRNYFENRKKDFHFLIGFLLLCLLLTKTDFGSTDSSYENLKFSNKKNHNVKKQVNNIYHTPSKNKISYMKRLERVIIFLSVYHSLRILFYIFSFDFIIFHVCGLKIFSVCGSAWRIHFSFYFVSFSIFTSIFCLLKPILCCLIAQHTLRYNRAQNCKNSLAILNLFQK